MLLSHMYSGTHLQNVHCLTHLYNPVILSGLIYGLIYSLFEKYVHIPGWAFHIPIKKNRVSHILFVEKRECVCGGGEGWGAWEGGLIIYLAVLKTGTIWHATSVLNPSLL